MLRKGLTLEQKYGLKRAEEIRKKLSLSHKGQIAWNKGTKGIVKPNKTSFKKGNKINLGKRKNKKYEEIFGEEKAKIIKEKLRKNNGKYWLGKHHSKKTKEKLSLINKKKPTNYWLGKKRISMQGEKNPAWKGGSSFEPYGLEFNRQLKEQIKKRDNYKCQQCFRHQDELFRNTKARIRRYKLNIHHIDYNKRNNKLNNLISLCNNCHMRTGFKREDWINYFHNQRMLQEK